jgi:hypothetical protein
VYSPTVLMLHSVPPEGDGVNSLGLGPLFAANAQGRVGQRLQPLAGNLLAAVFAPSERTVINAVECRLDLVENDVLPVIELDLLVQSFDVAVGGVTREVHDFARRADAFLNRLRVAGDVASQSVAQLDEPLAIFL